MDEDPDNPISRFLRWASSMDEDETIDFPIGNFVNFSGMVTPRGYDDDGDDDDNNDNDNYNNDGNGDDDNDDDNRNLPPTFNKSLPSVHSYLGNDMEERRGMTFWEEDTHHKIVLLYLPSVVLVPGQILPLSVVDPYTIQMLEHCIQERNGMFGVMLQWPLTYGKSKGPDFFGTTAEIYEYSKQSDSSGQTRKLKLKAKARQRFKCVEIYQNSGDRTLIEALVCILPEVILQDSFYNICPHINRQRSLKSNVFRKRNAMMTGWPLWVYDQYHPPKLVARVENELDSLKRGRDFKLPQNPTTLSFWIAQNLPPKQREYTLKLNSPIQRLRWELSVLKMGQMYMCFHCQTMLGKQRDIIAMSVDGPQGTYVNPEGFLHETVTFSKTQSLTALGRPSTEYSWFPGYAWIPAYCTNCRNHMGWKFIAAKENINPKTFWGLSRRSIVIKINVVDSDERVYVM